MRKIIPVLLSGGVGTRLWPLSNAAKPKQFHALAGSHTLIQETALRMKRLANQGLPIGPLVVIGAAAHADTILDQLESVGAPPALLVLEPMARDTAAAVALAAFAADELDPAALALVIPADHVIDDVAAFAAVLRRAAVQADTRIVTFGITPTGPETGFGYIEAGPALGQGVHAIARFHEKPDAATAADYLARGGFSWNAGMFLFRPGLMLEEYTSHAREVRDAASKAWFGARRANGAIQIDANSFAEAPKVSVDVAIMQKSAIGAVAPAAMQWADVGSWSEVLRLSIKDVNGVASQGHVALSDTTDSLVISDGVPIVVSGVEGVVVIASREGVLVIAKDRAQDVKTLLATLQSLPKS